MILRLSELNNAGKVFMYVYERWIDSYETRTFPENLSLDEFGLVRRWKKLFVVSRGVLNFSYILSQIL